MAKPPREMLSVLLRSGDGRVVPSNQQEEIGMEATVEVPSAQTRKDYTSRPGALSRFFRMSRDGWKSKCKDLKATVKGYKNRLAHMTRSREQWRIRAKRAGEQITTLEVEIAVLTTDCCGPGWRRWGTVNKNKTPRRTPLRVGPVSGEGFRGQHITPATKIRTNPSSRFGPATADRGSRGIRDQPRNPPKYTEKRIRINFLFPCPSRGQLPPVGWGRSVVTRL